MKRRLTLFLLALSTLALLSSGCLVHAPHGKHQRSSRSCKKGKVMVKHKGKWKCKHRNHKRGHKKHKKHKKH